MAQLSSSLLRNSQTAVKVLARAWFSPEACLEQDLLPGTLHLLEELISLWL